MSRSLPNPNSSHVALRPLLANCLFLSSPRATTNNGASCITALNIEFVAKPNEAHKVQTALPAAIKGALGEVSGFAGSLVMIANHETRLVTVVTLWRGEDRLQRCSENLHWVRALLAPYLDHCLRVQTLSAYGSESARVSGGFEESHSQTKMEAEVNESASLCLA